MNLKKKPQTRKFFILIFQLSWLENPSKISNSIWLSQHKVFHGHKNKIGFFAGNCEKPRLRLSIGSVYKNHLETEWVLNSPQIVWNPPMQVLWINSSFSKIQLTTSLWVVSSPKLCEFVSKLFINLRRTLSYLSVKFCSKINGVLMNLKSFSSIFASNLKNPNE